MLKPVRCASLVSLAAVAVLLSGAAPAGQTVVVKPTAPPAVQKPAGKPDAAKPDPAKPADKAESQKPEEKTQKPEPTTPPRPAPPPPPPDRQAFMAIQKMTDNGEKIAAIEKWLKDFPDSAGKTQALTLRFETLVKHQPTDRAAIMDAAQKVLDTGSEGFRSSPYSRVAGALLNAGIFLDDAARFAEKGLTLFEEDETKRVAQSRANHLATLGRIRFKQGRISAAEKALKAAYAANPEIPTALIGLAELSEHRKNSKAALNYWMQAALTGRLSKDDREKFETAYRKANNGTLDGLDAALDARYKDAFKPPVHPEPYKPTSMRTDKIVLAEVFTGAGCPPCVAADLAFDAALERYSRKELAVVMYHLHIPQPDPLTNKATIERAKYYTVNGVPTAAIEGVATVGGGARAATKGVYDRIRGTIDKALETASGAKLAVDASMPSSGIVKVKVTPSSLAADGEPVKLQILLVEEMLSYSGENGVRFHPMVVRGIAGESYGGFTVDRKAPVAREHTFDVAQISAEHKAHLDDYEVNGRHGKITFSRKPTTINQGNLSVVVFLQEEKTKKVLQTSYVRLRPWTTSTGSIGEQ